MFRCFVVMFSFCFIQKILLSVIVSPFQEWKKILTFEIYFHSTSKQMLLF